MERKTRNLQIMRGLAVLFVFCFLALQAVPVQAKTVTRGEVENKLNQLYNEYPANSKWTRSFAGGSHCYAFAHYVFNNIFGRGNAQVGNGAVTSNPTCYKLNNLAKDITVIGTLGPGYSLSSLEGLLEQVKPGDFIQVKRNGTGGAHSMIAIGVDKAGNSLAIYDANAVAPNTVGKYNQSFSYFKQRNAGVTVYRYQGYSSSSPSLSVDNLPEGSTISGTQPIVGHVSDGGTYPWLELYVDYGYVQTTCNNAEGNYAFYLDTTKYGDGEHLIGVKLRNQDGFDYTEWRHVKIQNHVTHNPIGNFEGATGGEGFFEIGGWVFDEDVPREAIELHVYIGGPSGQGEMCASVKADLYRRDVNQAYAWLNIGDYHGFSKKIYTNRTGRQDIYVYAINAGGGIHNPLLGKRTVVIQEDRYQTAIKNVRITDVTSSGYTVRCTVADNGRLDRVQFPTWTEKNGQDDIQKQWQTSSKVSGIRKGNEYSYRVNYSDHNQEKGIYNTHIYAYTKSNAIAGIAAIGACIDFSHLSSVEATGHSLIKDPAVKATCIQTGKTEGSHCSVCGKIQQKQELIPKAGHTFGEWKIQKAATCTAEGMQVRNCTVCQKKEEKSLPKSNHKAVTDPAVKATCTRTGKTEGSHCSVCKAVLKKQEILPKTDHSFGEWEILQAATCTTEGVHVRSCTVCDKQEKKNLPVLNHEAVTDAAIEATCTQPGKTEGSHCSVCGKVLVAQKLLPKKDHLYEKMVIKATLDRNGEKKEACSTCGKIKSTQVIYRPETVTLSPKSSIYTGKENCPQVKVTDQAGADLPSDMYDLAYRANVEIGRGYVDVIFKNEYEGTITKGFDIRPAVVKVKKVTAQPGKIKVYWDKAISQNTNYIVEYSTESKFSRAKSVKVGSSKNSVTLQNLKANKKYYVRVRAYKNVKINGKNKVFYSGWSDRKAVTVKKNG